MSRWRSDSVIGLAQQDGDGTLDRGICRQRGHAIRLCHGKPVAFRRAGRHARQPDPNYAGYQVDKDHSYYDDVAGTPGANMANFSSTEPSASPIQIAFNVVPGATITITNTSGLVSYDHDTAVFVDPTGNGGTTWICDDAKSGGVSEHGIADATMPIGSLNAVFLGSGLPDSLATPPTPLNYSTQAARDYVGLQPKMQQPFYVGTGTTSGGSQQEITVPANATRMFTWDAWMAGNGTITSGASIAR